MRKLPAHSLCFIASLYLCQWHLPIFQVVMLDRNNLNRGFNYEVQFIFIELEGSAGVKFKLSNPTKDERVNEEIQSADRRSTIPD